MIGRIAVGMSHPHSRKQILQSSGVLLAIEQWTVHASLPHFVPDAADEVAIVAQANGDRLVFLSAARNQFGTAECVQLRGGDAIVRNSIESERERMGELNDESSAFVSEIADLRALHDIP